MTLLLIFTLQALHANLLRVFPLIFIIRFLATDLNTGIITRLTLQISLYQVSLNYNKYSAAAVATLFGSLLHTLVVS
jgi:hypothetical protein